MHHWKLGVLVLAITASGCHGDRAADSPDDYDGKVAPTSGDGAPSSEPGVTTTTQDVATERATTTGGPPPIESAAPVPERRASAAFISAKTHRVKGSATFAETAQGVQILFQIAGAPPGEKGLHIHETNDCSDIPGKSMGAHFAGATPAHGLPEGAYHHLGDLGNIRIASDGTGFMEVIVPNANLKTADALSFLQRSVVLHESRDDGTGDSGNSGKPIACAPIQRLDG